jgi:hypothetical protein
MTFGWWEPVLKALKSKRVTGTAAVKPVDTFEVIRSGSQLLPAVRITAEV